MAGQVYVKSGKSFRYQAIYENVVGRGAHGKVFAGHFKPNLNSSWNKVSGEVKQAAIKRVEINFSEENWMDIKNDREVVALKELRHPCIVRLFAVEDDGNFRNYIFELCQGTLEDFITKKYDRLIMPVETEGLYQMASGLRFIHEKKMIHRDIKPENVLVYLHEEGQRRAWLKISDLGFTKPLKEDGIHYDLASGLKGTEHYMAPELNVLKNSTERVLDKDCTIASDVYAAGCTFFRYLNGGLHPFGKGFNIELNILEGNPINVTIDESLSPVIVEQNENFDKTGTMNVGDVQFDRRKILGRERYGMVFAGTFKGEKVAVKRIDIMDSNPTNNREVLNLQLLNHPNVVQFIHFEKDNDFGYIVLERCAASLQDYYIKEGFTRKYKGPMPTDEQVLFQLANGLEYIHSKKILHRDISPANILISLTKPVEMKWSGFGSSKPVNERGSCSLSGLRGTDNWMSPEQLRIMMKSEENADHGRGSIKRSPLAVKKVPRENCTTKSFEELKQINHPNIIRFLHFHEDDLYKYFGMEMCVASLDHLFLPDDDPKKYKGPIPSDEQFCFQLISGLEYIHEQNLVHGSIKPTNILISSKENPQIKLSDFGFTTSCLNDGHSTKRLISGFLSSQYWLAPELLESSKVEVVLTT
ncbi:hypothetical protein DAPPUDRAFT_325040 [Daphnia pulex]|uniref:Protein kinase domain-containing protein n=1 Tax=Daphnia pulex TaxID=6669 RepID=E9H3I9_DAPPU|nr:hypothetical protein DAPPUDRAFT_325040 [Daphnia pulex]|eukprot:EFX73522.1 hypothetical protein DAPPUDRAFT_325040 [Daphnia pulex]